MVPIEGLQRRGRAALRAAAGRADGRWSRSATGCPSGPCARTKRGVPACVKLFMKPADSADHVAGHVAVGQAQRQRVAAAVGEAREREAAGVEPEMPRPRVASALRRAARGRGHGRRPRCPRCAYIDCGAEQQEAPRERACATKCGSTRLASPPAPWNITSRGSGASAGRPSGTTSTASRPSSKRQVVAPGRQRLVQAARHRAGRPCGP